MSDLAALGALVFQAGLVLLLAVAARRRNVPAAVNALVSLGAALSPRAVELLLRSATGTTVALPPELSLWVAAAGFLHALGMLGPYDTVWWWDHLTHAVSAALLAALLYAGLLVVADSPTGIDLPVAGLLTVVLTLALGICWELVELVARDVGERIDVEPVLVHYGWRDTALDLVFDVAGALAVVLLDLRLFVPTAAPFPRATRTLLVGAVVAVVGGATVLGLYLLLADRAEATLP